MVNIDMNEINTYTLAELAGKTGLTERTVRYYIEQVLPPHHKQGRGKLARYGEDTLNCIRFILLVKKRYGFKPGQAKGVLADVPQETIDRVLRGEEELAVMTVPSAPHVMESRRVGRMRSASERLEKYGEVEPLSRLSTESIMDVRESRADLKSFKKLSQLKGLFSPESHSEPVGPWQTIFTDEQIRIQCRSKHKLTEHQEEQIKAAAKLIELTLKKSP